MSLKLESQQQPKLDRHDRLLEQFEHDPYHSRLKLKEPSVCSDCGAVFHKGRWAWSEAPADAHKALCPACARTRDEIPAAYLNLRGTFVTTHRTEIMQLARNLAQRERAEHPLKRIMDIEESYDGMKLSFTEAHLAREVGEALHKAYKGELNYHYIDAEIMLRVNWTRDE
jgi:NMD protein affecting ribosome stability and mRNA decay